MYTITKNFGDVILYVFDAGLWGVAVLDRLVSHVLEREPRHCGVLPRHFIDSRLLDTCTVIFLVSCSCGLCDEPPARFRPRSFGCSRAGNVCFGGQEPHNFVTFKRGPGNIRDYFCIGVLGR